MDPTETAPRLVPILWIEVGGKSIPKDSKVAGKIKVIENHDGSLVASRVATAAATLSTAIGIEVRGNYSAGHPKKPYGIELRDDAGVEKELPLLGMPPGSDWVLYAPYVDKTLIRYALMLSIARDFGRYNPRTRFVEVFVDGDYKGVYMVIEKIRRDKYRVNIPRPAPDSASGDVTGGYIFRYEGGGKGVRRDWKSTQGTTWTYHYPRHDSITTEQKKYLHDHVNKFETVLKGPEWAHPLRGYRPFIDALTWVDYCLVQELGNGWDGYARSVYLSKESKANGDLVSLSPLWDYDVAFGNIPWYNHRTDNWAYRNPRVDQAVLYFFPKLWGDPPFRNDLRCRWQALRKTVITPGLLNARIDAWVKYLAAAEKRDHVRWPVIGTTIFPPIYGPTTNYFVGKTYQEEIQWMRGWIEKRISWLDANIPGSCAAN